MFIALDVQVKCFFFLKYFTMKQIFVCVNLDYGFLFILQKMNCLYKQPNTNCGMFHFLSVKNFMWFVVCKI